jgi:hypothetical protein
MGRGKQCAPGKGKQCAVRPHYLVLRLQRARARRLSNLLLKFGATWKTLDWGEKKGGKYYWDPEIIFGAICSFSKFKFGDDETKVSVMARTSTYSD